MYTGQEIHNMAISVIDEISENGTIDPNKTKEYANRAPYLLDAWQKEMADSGRLYNISEFENIDTEALGKWTKLSLPANFRMIWDMIFIDVDQQFGEIEYKLFGNSDIYFFFNKLGTVRILYIPVPTKITALTQAIEIDDITAMSGAYYLAEQYAMADQNSELAQTCRNKFKSLKIESMITTPLSNTEIKDVYNVSWGG